MSTASKEEFRRHLLRILFESERCGAASCPPMRRLRDRILSIPFGISNERVLRMVLEACHKELADGTDCRAVADLVPRYEALLADGGGHS